MIQTLLASVSLSVRWAQEQPPLWKRVCWKVLCVLKMPFAPISLWCKHVHHPFVSFWNASGETLHSGNHCHFSAELELALKSALLFRERERVFSRHRGWNDGNSNEPHEHLLFLFGTSESPCGNSSAQSSFSLCAREDVRTPGSRLKQGYQPLTHPGPCHQK